MKQLINKIVSLFGNKKQQKQSTQRIAEEQYNLLKLKQLQNHEAKNKNSNSSNRTN